MNQIISDKMTIQISDSNGHRYDLTTIYDLEKGDFVDAKGSGIIEIVEKHIFYKDEEKKRLDYWTIKCADGIEHCMYDIHLYLKRIR